MKNRPFVLVICDGWGFSEDNYGNAIKQADTPFLDELNKKWPNTLVKASGDAVGLPEGQQGNSEVGHLTIGAGRVIKQSLSRQQHEISSGAFYENEVLIDAIEIAKQRGSSLHILGLVSPGGVHSHTDGAVAVAKLAYNLGLKRVHIHAFTDGRDTPPNSAKVHIEKFEKDLQQVKSGKIVSISGRYYAMDRDNRWDRVELAYNVLTAVDHPFHPHANEYIEQRYKMGEFDEFIKPISISESSSDRVRINDGDVVIFFNFRADRARQLTRALIDADFMEFSRQRVVHDLHVVTFTEYDKELGNPVVFDKEDVDENLADIISKNNLRQFHLAETEKYAHVTYFFNGGREKAYKGEERELVPSLKIATYDLAPDMKADAITDIAIDRINSQKDDFIVLNFANADMVGHTGFLDIAKSAIEKVDECIGKIVSATLKNNGAILVTADHGNAEVMLDKSNGEPITSHTDSLVPVLLCGTDAKSLTIGGGLEDIAPTVLDAMGIAIPLVMSGNSLINL